MRECIGTLAYKRLFMASCELAFCKSAKIYSETRYQNAATCTIPMPFHCLFDVCKPVCTRGLFVHLSASVKWGTTEARTCKTITSQPKQQTIVHPQRIPCCFLQLRKKTRTFSMPKIGWILSRLYSLLTSFSHRKLSSSRTFILSPGPVKTLKNYFACFVFSQMIKDGGWSPKQNAQAHIVPPDLAYLYTCFLLPLIKRSPVTNFVKLLCTLYTALNHQSSRL